MVLEQSEELSPHLAATGTAVSKVQLVVAGLCFQRNQVTVKLMPLLLPNFIRGMALGTVGVRSVPGEGRIWDVHGAWCSTPWERPSQKS